LSISFKRREDFKHQKLLNQLKIRFIIHDQGFKKKTPELQDLWLEFDVNVIMLVLSRYNTQSAELYACTVTAVRCIAVGGYWLLLFVTLTNKILF
jgi:hypothetical protein